MCFIYSIIVLISLKIISIGKQYSNLSSKNGLIIICCSRCVVPTYAKFSTLYVSKITILVHTNYYFVFKFNNIFEVYLQCDSNTSIRISDVICVSGNCLDRCSHTHSTYTYYSSSFYGRYYYQCNRGSMRYRTCGLNQSFYPGRGSCGSYTILFLI